MDLGPDLVLCPQQLPYTINLQGLPDAEHFLWDDGTTDPVFVISQSGTYGVTVSNDCFEVWDFIEVTVEDAPPSVALPADTTLCPGQTLFLDVQNISGTYLWQDGSQTGVYSVTEPGTYSVTVSNACGDGSDEIVVDFAGSLPQLDLGPDVSLCPGEQITIHAGVTGVELTWQDGSTLDSLVVTTTQTVILTASNDCGVVSDTLEVTVSGAAPDAMLPATLSICEGEQVTIQTTIAGATYQWNTGATTPSITVDSVGEYILTITNACGMDIDTTIVTALGTAPVIDLGPDMMVCEGEFVVFDPGGAGDYVWHDGSTLPTYTATTPGLVIVTVTNVCGSATDSAYVTYLDTIPVFDLGPDTSICPGTVVVFDPGISGVDYLWSDGTTDPLFSTVSGGEVVLQISNACGAVSDTVDILVLPDVPVLDLGQDFSICPGESLVLDPGIPDVNYVWGDGSTGMTFTITEPGEILLTVSNACGADTDTIIVTEDPNGPVLDLGPDISLCEGESVVVAPGINGVQYLWHDGSTGPSIEITQTTTVVLQVSNACGMDTDTLDVLVSGSSPQIDLGGDLLLCDGEETELMVNGALNTIQWQDGSSNPVITVNSEGWYWVVVSNNCGEASDSVFVATAQSPEPFDLVKTRHCVLEIR